MRYMFGDYTLDEQRYELCRLGQRVPLEPKAFDLLVYLLQHRARVVGRSELLEQVWPDRFVSDHSLTARLRAVRQALGETARNPQYIETVRGRGYRFIASINTAPESAEQHEFHPYVASAGCSKATVSYPMVGRTSEMAYLHECLDRVWKGTRQIVFVTAEVGLGKTTLVDKFIQEMEHTRAIRIGRGQCIEHYGIGEAYLPVLEALEQLCQSSEGCNCIEIFVQQAPTWIVQMPWFLKTADLDKLQRTTLGGTRERMLREMVRALEILTAEKPLLLVLEDLHWSDASTLDFLAMLARRQEAARLFVLGTYRPGDVKQQDHPLYTVARELRLHGYCEELSLVPLSEAEVATYLTARLPGIEQLDALARFVHRRSEGNPLFMATIIDEIMAENSLATPADLQRLLMKLPEAELGVPVSLRQLLEQRLDRLSAEEQLVLEVGSVVGVDFTAAVVASICEAEVEQVERCCEGLARREQWLQSRGQEIWPNGTVSERYGFIHAFYQEVVYSRVTAARRLRLHRQIGKRLEAGYEGQAQQLAAELAVHFEQGRVYQRAVEYCHQAAENASQRCAYQEAMMHLSKGLALLETLTETPERTRSELALLLTLALVLRNTRGQTASEVGETYARAHALCQQIEDAPQLFPVLRGLWNYYNNRAELRTAHDLAEQIFSLSQRQHDPTLILWSHGILGMTDQYNRGAYASAREHFEHVLTLYNRQQHRSLVQQYGFDPGVIAFAFSAWTSWLLGYPERALQQSRDALTLARELEHPYTLAAALNWAAMFHQFRREWKFVHERAEAVIALASEYGFAQRLAWGEILRGRALAEQDQGVEAVGQIRRGLAALRAAGQALWRPYNLALLAEVYGKIGWLEDGLRTLVEALALVEKTGDCFWESELHRLKGEFLLRQRVANDYQAESCYQQALVIARRRQASTLELRAAISLSWLWLQQGKRHEARQLLAPIYDGFTEGFETADLQEAKTLLDTLL